MLKILKDFTTATRRFIAGMEVKAEELSAELARSGRSLEHLTAKGFIAAGESLVAAGKAIDPEPEVAAFGMSDTGPLAEISASEPASKFKAGK